MVIGASYFSLKGIQRILFKKSDSRRYPPGPPRDPVIGCLRSFPKSQFLETFCEWVTAYGDIIYAPIPGNDIVILNSYEVAQELLSKRPSSTAGRNVGYLIELMGWGWDLVFLQPGPSHSSQRKILRRAVGPQSVGSHDPVIEATVMKFMNELNTFQGCPIDVIQSSLGEMASKATYGGQIWDEMGADLTHWNTDAAAVNLEAMFSFWLVNVFHFLRFTPDWVPGLRFKELVKEGNDLSEKVRFRAFDRGVKLHKSGLLEHSFLQDLLEEFGELDEVRDALAVLYIASSDTMTAGAIQFLHSLFIFPEVAEKVFEEIKSVTQGHRLPKISDRPNLPFTEAVWKEATRWSPFVPLGAPHVSSEDEVIQGYFIPKGAIIHQNIRMILHDPRLWEDPKVFRPERFLEPGAAQRPNPLTVHFGWGLRACPGMYFADRVVFHLVTAIIALYKIEPLEGSKRPDPNNIEYTMTSIQHPVGFECRFVPRDEKARNLLKTISLHE